MCSKKNSLYSLKGTGSVAFLRFVTYKMCCIPVLHMFWTIQQDKQCLLGTLSVIISQLVQLNGYMLEH
jgi:hypothetical protein